MARVVLVTGGARGIGRAIAIKFLENKDIVYINYNNSYDDALELSKVFSNARIIKADIAREEEIKLMIDEIKVKEGKLDIIINNAGIAIDTTIDDKTKENFRKILDINLIGAFLVIKYGRKIMNKGIIINIASTNGIDTNYPYSLDYDASKAGLISLTHNLALELAPNIRVNAIAPGWVKTDMNKDLDEDFINKECDNIMLGRFGEAKEIANVVFFVASDEASYINNSVIRVDGGTK